MIKAFSKSGHFMVWDLFNRHPSETTSDAFKIFKEALNSAGLHGIIIAMEQESTNKLNEEYNECFTQIQM